MDKMKFAGKSMMRLARLSFFLVILLIASGLISSSRAQVSNCQAVASFTYPDTSITAMNSNVGGPYVSSDTWHIAYTNLPPYCEIQATITPAVGSTIKVKVWLPTQRYNGRYLGTGNGGYAGAFFDSELAQGINNGFATAQTDLGMGTCGSVNLNADLCSNPENWKDFGYRATHLTTDFAKALIQVFYGQSANKSYFAGCSTGGQQALMAAQRYPNDYDGILAGASAYNRTHLHTILIASYRATHMPATGFIPPAKFDVVNAAVVNQCRRPGKDAPTDNFIGNPATCRFDAASLQCPGNVDGPSCLTTDQVNAMNVYYQGAVNSVTGALIHPGPSRGSETSNATSLGFVVNEAGAEPAFDSLFKWVFGLTWQWSSFDFNQDVATVDQVLAADLNATNHDLSAFKNRGGKLILYHGWADPLLPSVSTVNYYNEMAQTMFGESGVALDQTQTFSRLYMAPGVWHCGGSLGPGPGPSSFGGMIQQPAPSFDPQHDLLSALTHWVEDGSAPGSVIATKYNNDQPTAGIQMQRPLCVYPKVASYRGGDANLPASFTCDIDALAAHDFNGDGKSDILWRNSAGDLAMWLMDGATASAVAGLGNVSPIWSIVGQRDFNGDGKNDIVWRDTAGNLAMWLMNGITATQVASLGNVSTIWSVAGTGDFNGDGKGDILWRNTAGDIAIWLMNGTVASQVASLGNLGPTWGVVAVADFNGDGKADILWRNTAGDLAMWLMNSVTVSQVTSLGNVSTSWTVAGTADFNGDGKGDLLWRDASGNMAMWLMNGTVTLQVASLGRVDTSWSVASNGDYDGGAKGDILWRHASGDIAMWVMNGFTASQVAGLGSVPTNWVIQNANAN